MTFLEGLAKEWMENEAAESMLVIAARNSVQQMRIYRAALKIYSPEEIKRRSALGKAKGGSKTRGKAVYFAGDYVYAQSSEVDEHAVHRGVMAHAFGVRKLPKGYVVHHIDGNTHNNHPDNLALCTRKGHARIHALYR